MMPMIFRAFMTRVRARLCSRCKSRKLTKRGVSAEVHRGLALVDDLGDVLALELVLPALVLELGGALEHELLHAHLRAVERDRVPGLEDDAARPVLERGARVVVALHDLAADAIFPGDEARHDGSLAVAGEGRDLADAQLADAVGQLRVRQLRLRELRSRDVGELALATLDEGCAFLGDELA